MPRNLVACECGCGTSAPLYRTTYVRPVVTVDGRQKILKGAQRLCRKDHAREFGIELSRRANLSEWLRIHARPGIRGWWHRFCRWHELYDLVKAANFRSPERDRCRSARQAVLLFLVNKATANQLAVMFEMTDRRRTKPPHADR